jgi:hypothetical protein
MKLERFRTTLSWLLVAVNLIAGSLWVMLALGWLTGQEGVSLRYLAIGVVCFVASAAWLFSVTRN